MLAAYTNEKKLPDALNLYVLDEAEHGVEDGHVMKTQLKAALRPQCERVPVSQAQLGTGLLDGSYAWAAAPDNGWVDLDDWVFPILPQPGTRTRSR